MKKSLMRLYAPPDTTEDDPAQDIPERERWEEYERRKAQLPAGLDADEYEDALTRILDDLNL